MIWGFVGPALAIILVNIFFLCCTFYVMGRRQSWAKADKNMVAKIKYWAKGAAIVTCLLGVTWVFGVFFLNSDSVAVAYIFNICNVFQGLFIFVFHCLLDEKIRQQYYQVLCAVANVESRSPTHSTATATAGKKEQRRSTFNSWLWSVSPMKLQDSKSESCPTVGENTLKRTNSSTHSLSPYIDRRLMEIKRDSDTMRPRGMSSIYHDSDENMDNIPDNILTVKHGSKNNSGRLDFQDEDTTGGVFEDDLMTTLSRENSREFQDVPQATCEDCLYEIKEWEEQQEILGKTNSFLERELKTLKAPCGALKPEQRYLNQETNMDDKLCQDNIKDKEEQQELLPDESDIKQSDQCKSFISVVPHIVLSDFSKSRSGTSPKCYWMVDDVTDAIGAETSGVHSPTSV
ncbi:adhesion G -coupled receptor L2-like isoform X7 [Paramuricea clavata]|uniref:Adhesion G -coupled receptor L2-like isoform X7 n=1 Tax=Paramuricea clavata TaxID=317549 RepID=A0A6S7KE78_PARCT|nr:adhesion G -coupled receptor L2-like isoform X7 [Paramuricea clavata]